MNFNQIYKNSDTNLSFADWMALHRAQHMGLRKQFPNLPFHQFMMMKFEKGQLNADAETNWLDDIIDITKQTYDKYQGKAEPGGEVTTTGTPVESGSSIFGMSPMVAYSVGGVVLLTIGTIIYLKYKKQNE